MSKFIDLKLPASEIPGEISSKKAISFQKEIDRLVFQEQETFKSPRAETIERLTTKNTPVQTAAIGCHHNLYNGEVCQGDTGLFGVIFEAWANHWNLHTTPEDWWLVVITKVAAMIDHQANKKEVRDFFVSFEGKRELEVELPSFTIYDSNYDFLFRKFSEAINENIKVPGYVDTMTHDFSTTSPEQLICSEIAIMKSMQKYFDYTMVMCGCGIKAVEMKGSEADWNHLLVKLKALRKLLKPLEKILSLEQSFRNYEQVFKNLLKTYQGKNTSAWWADILINGQATKRGASGMNIGSVPAYNGWLVEFALGAKSMKAEEFKKGDHAEELSCLSSVPMKIVDAVRNLSDSSTLVAGILGATLTKPTETSNGVPTLTPAHGWVLMLPPDSKLRAV